MKRSMWILAILLLVVPIAPAGAADWTVPVCDSIFGTNAVSYTTDGGLSLAETRPLMNYRYTYGLLPLDVDNTLLAANMSTAGTSILRSEDAGCEWKMVKHLPEDDVMRFSAGPGDTTYGWSSNRTVFVRIEGTDVVKLSAPAMVYGLAVDSRDAQHVRIGSNDCQLYESFDGGESFSLLNGPANTGAATMFTVEFDPINFDHALCGAKGAYRTTDAGRSWSTIPPFDFADIDLVHMFKFSPADPRWVWARANLDTMGSNTREILVSNDGGASFGPAIVQWTKVYDQNGVERTVMLSNQPTMAAHPEDPALLYFTWTASSCCPYEIEGEILCSYDAEFGNLRAVLVEGVDGINAIEFNPADSDVMYFGLEGFKDVGQLDE
jgi:hypothetical protein